MVLALACEAGGGDGPDIRGEYVDLYLGEGIEVCGRQVQAYDRFVEEAHAVYGGELPVGFQAALHASDSDEDLPCDGLAGCARGGSAWFSNMRGAYHELVHTLQSDIDGDSLRSLKEGTAQALGPPFAVAFDAEQVAAFSQAPLFSTTLDRENYDMLAVYSRFLLERYGPARYRAFFRAMSDASADIEATYRERFAATFDEPFDDAWAAFIAEPRCAYDFWYCSDDSTTLVELPFELDGLDCDDPLATGFDVPSQDPKDASFAREKLFAFDLASAATVAFEFEYVSVDLARCGDCSQQTPTAGLSALPAEAPTIVELELGAGRHSMIVRDRPGGAPLLRVYPVE